MICYEMSSKRTDGRRHIKLALHEIHPDNTHYNINGITYLEKYTVANGNSIIGMPICAAFLDESEKAVPFDHGFTGIDGAMPLYEDSLQVGAAESWGIEDIEIDGEKKRVCYCEGYINEQRYPNFVKWLEEKQASGDQVFGSVEFVGVNDSGIVYDGGYKEKGRIPMEYRYSGYCILTVKPADNTAVMMEFNQIKKEEESEMDEKVLSLLIGAIKEAMSEKTERDMEMERKLNEVNAKCSEYEKNLAEKDKKIDEMNAKCEEYQAAISKKDEEINACKTDAEKNAAELTRLREQEKKTELNKALENYTDEEKGFAKNELDAFEKDPLNVEVNSIIDKINMEIGKKAKAKQVEINSKNDDIYDSMNDYDMDHELDFSNMVSI